MYTQNMDKNNPLNNTRLSILVKTDLSGFTTKTRSASAEVLDKILKFQTDSIQKTLIDFGATIIKEEGDAYWVTFLNMQSACDAAIAIQDLTDLQRLKTEISKLGIRICIHVGDVRFTDCDLFGSTVNYVARMEQKTPPGNIYISKIAESLVNRERYKISKLESLTFKGFPGKQILYSIQPQTYHTKDSGHFLLGVECYRLLELMDSIQRKELEQIIRTYNTILSRICKDFGGEIFVQFMDIHILVFPNYPQAMQAGSQVIQEWDSVKTEIFAENTFIGIQIHFGEIERIGSFVFGPSMFEMSELGFYARYELTKRDRNMFIVTERAFREAKIKIKPDVIQHIASGKQVDLLKGTQVFEILPVS